MSTVLDWFNNIQDEEKASFIQFIHSFIHSKSFDPSITEELLCKAIRFAKGVQKDEDGDFDLSTGCYDRVEVSEIVGFYLLNLLSNILDKSKITLYRDDGLAIMRNFSGPQIESKRKHIIKIFKDCKLNITIQANLCIVNFLDITLDTGIFKPYRKPDDTSILISLLVIINSCVDICLMFHEIFIILTKPL